MKKNDMVFVLSEIVVLSLISIICLNISHFIGLTLFIIIIVLIISTTQIIIYRRLQKQSIDSNASINKKISEDYKQIESLFSIYSTLKITRPLPLMRNWAISPDFASILISIIFECKPKLILEASSGVSTLISSYCIKELGNGKVLALDHDQSFGKKTENNIFQHGLDGYASVVYAPLKTVDINNKKWLWYDTIALKGIDKIDVVIVDGPPSTIQKMARYPALPLLFHKLNDKSILIIDDTNRDDEKKIIEAWMNEFNCFSCEVIENEKGATILRKIHRTNN
jgi:hypothetical protein